MTDFWQQRWWRIRFISTQAAVSPRIARIRFYGNSGAADDWTVPTQGISDTGFADTNSNNAADSSTSTNWISGTSAPNSWVGARIYGGPAQIKEVGITAVNDANFGGAPSAFWIEGSNDPDGAVPVNWKRLAYVAAGTWTQGSTQTFAFTVSSTSDTGDITRVAAETGYSTARTALLSTVSTEVLQKPSGVNTRLGAVTTQVLTTNINNGSASGVTITATCSIISGVVNINAKATSTTTDTITYVTDPVTYNSDPVILPMAGTATVNFYPGIGSPGVPGVTSPGIVVTATYSIIAGSASVTYGTPATANGDTVTATASIIAGTASTSVNATANGDTLVATESLIAGTAFVVVNATANGATLSRAYSILSGNGSGTANASGAIVPSTFTLIPGGESGTANVGGNRVTMDYSLTPGTAVGEKNATIPAQTLTTSHSIIAGLVTTTVNLTGQTLVENDTLIPGAVSVNSTARGNIIPFTPSLIKGAVTVDTEILGRVIHVDFTLPENTLGVVTAGANTPAEIVAFSHQVLEEGVATGTAVAPAAIVSFGHTVLNGALHADANLDAGTTFNISVTLEPGVGFWFIGSPGDVMVEPRVDARMELLAEVRDLTVVVETRAIIVPHEDRAMALGPRLKKVI